MITLPCAALKPDPASPSLWVYSALDWGGYCIPGLHLPVAPHPDTLTIASVNAQYGRLPIYLLPQLLFIKNPALKINKSYENLWFEGLLFENQPVR